VGVGPIVRRRHRSWTTDTEESSKTRGLRLGQTSGWMVGQELVGVSGTVLAHCLQSLLW